jgi:hypothetical protein
VLLGNINKNNMAAASLQSMRNFWKEFNLPELQVLIILEIL